MEGGNRGRGEATGGAGAGVGTGVAATMAHETALQPQRLGLGVIHLPGTATMSLVRTSLSKSNVGCVANLLLYLSRWAATRALS